VEDDDEDDDELMLRLLESTKFDCWFGTPGSGAVDPDTGETRVLRHALEKNTLFARRYGRAGR
jgi:hypothetical protein